MKQMHIKDVEPANSDRASGAKCGAWRAAVVGSALALLGLGTSPGSAQTRPPVAVREADPGSEGAGAYLRERENALAAMLEDDRAGRDRAIAALSSDDHRQHALGVRALGHLARAEDIGLLRADLAHEDREMRILAAESLARVIGRGVVTPAAAFGEAEARLASVSLGVSRFVQDELFRIADAPRSVSWSHGRAYEAVVRLGEFAVPALERFAEDRFYFATAARCYALVALGRVGDRAATEFLLSFLAGLDRLQLDRLPEENVPMLRAAAIAALTLQGASGPEVIRAYLEAADSSDEFTRVYGAWGLFDVLSRCDQAARVEIREAVKEFLFFDSDESVLSTLVLALQYSGEPVDAEVIAERLSEHARLVDPYLLDAAWSLGGSTEAIREAFRAQLDSRHPASRLVAATHLEEDVDPADVAATVEMLERNTTSLPDRSSFTERSALMALGIAGRSEALEAILALANTSDDQVRSTVAFVLGRLGRSEAADTLAGLLDDRGDYVRYFAAQSLGMLADPRAVPGWIDALASGNAYLMENAIASLETLAGTRLGFRSTAISSERLASVRAWREWHREHAPRVVAREGRLQLDKP